MPYASAKAFLESSWEVSTLLERGDFEVKAEWGALSEDKDTDNFKQQPEQSGTHARRGLREVLGFGRDFHMY